MWRFNALIDRLTNFLQSVYGKPVAQKQALPEVIFECVYQVEKPPLENEVRRNAFYLVAFREKQRWVLFQCPCGCNTVITLSLQGAHTPHWQLAISKAARPTLRPSIWRDVGCMSHFWINDGRVYWCDDTGSNPKIMNRRI